MKSLSSVGLGLSVVFGCLFLALIAELYYLLLWKKRFTSSSREIDSEYYSSNPAREFLYMFCWRRPSSLSHTALNPQELRTQESSSNKDNLLLKSLNGDENGDGCSSSIETELMRLHNLSGPPRFLFTIIEETKEDLAESEDGKSRTGGCRKGSRSRSLSDLLFNVESTTPYLTPLASPPFFTPPLTPPSNYNQLGFNPLFEHSTDAEFNKIRSSPPPRFKFLQDAEEKLHRRKLIEEEEEEANKKKDEDDGSFITIIVDDRNKDIMYHSSSCSQVLPLASSPSTFSSTPTKKNSNY